jgi:hypothetical protein
MIFKYPERVVIRDTPRQDIGRLYGGNMKMLEMDEPEPQRRPAGFVEPHSSGAKKFISNGNSASYPVFNSVEQKSIDTKKGGLMRIEKGGLRPMPVLEGGDFARDLYLFGKQKKDEFDDFTSASNITAMAKQAKNMLKGGYIHHPKDTKLIMVGNGLWQDISKDPNFQTLIKDPRIQSLAKQGLDELNKKIGSGAKRGRGRPRKGTMEGEGIWEDMNAWGKQNEVNFNKFGQDVEATAKGILNNPQVQAVMNDPAVQKMGKSAVKTAVSYIPVVGPPASTALGLMGWGGVPRKEIVKRVMAEKNMSLIEASKYVKANNLYQAKPRGKKH